MSAMFSSDLVDFDVFVDVAGVVLLLGDEETARVSDICNMEVIRRDEESSSCSSGSLSDASCIFKDLLVCMSE